MAHYPLAESAVPSVKVLLESPARAPPCPGMARCGRSVRPARSPLPGRLAGDRRSPRSCEGCARGSPARSPQITAAWATFRLRIRQAEGGRGRGVARQLGHGEDRGTRRAGPPTVTSPAWVLGRTMRRSLAACPLLGARQPIQLGGRGKTVGSSAPRVDGCRWKRTDSGSRSLGLWRPARMGPCAEERGIPDTYCTPASRCWVAGRTCMIRLRSGPWRSTSFGSPKRISTVSPTRAVSPWGNTATA